MERLEIAINGKTYDYFLVRKDVKTVKLTVNKQSQTIVSAPAYITQKKIREFVASNVAFIENNLEKRKEIERLHNLNEYKTGEHFLLFGDRKNIVAKNFSQNKVVLEGKTLYILLTENTAENRKKQFDIFLKNMGKETFNALLNQHYFAFSQRIKIKPSITVRKMKTKWGSANPSKNKITLNTALLFAPKDLIAYVLLHELCHFYYLDHSKRFYAKLVEVVPDYKQKRKRLRETYGFLI